MRNFLSAIIGFSILCICSISSAQSGEFFTSGRTTEGIIVQDEGVTVSLAPYLNFVGDAIEVTSDSVKMYVTANTSDSVSASSGGSDTEIQYNNSGSLDGISNFIWNDTNIIVKDDQNFAFGTSAEWTINYDDSVDDQLLIQTAKTSAIATGDAMIEVLVDTGVAGMTANQQVFGVAKGSQASNTELFTVDEDGDGVFAGTVTGTFSGNITGNVTGNADTVTTNANLTGEVTSVGNAAVIVESFLQENGASEILGETLGTACTENQILKANATGGLDCAADATGAGGSAITFDIGDDGGNDSVDVNEIATTGDTNSIFTESAADKILIAVGNNWPTADTANAGDSATAFFSSGTIEHERGGLEADISAYDGLVGVTGGATYNQTGTTTQIIIFDGAGVPTSAALSGDVTMTNGGVVTIGSDKVLESMFKAVDAAADEECLTYESTTGDFEWQTCGSSATGDSVQINGTQVDDPNFINGQVSLSESNDIVTLNITDGTIVEADLDVSNSPTDNYILSYNDAGANFTWIEDTGGASTDDSVQINGSQVSDPNFIDTSTITISEANDIVQFNIVNNSSATEALWNNSGVIDGMAEVKWSSSNKKLTFADDSTLDLSGINMSDQLEGFAIPTSTDCTTGTILNGLMCWDNDDNTLYVGDTGSGAVAISGGASTDDSVQVNGAQVADPDFRDGQVTLTNVDNLITLNISDNSILEVDLKAVDSASDEECLTYESTTGDFEWQACGSFDATAIDAVTWSDGANASNVWTFDVSGTDPTITFGSASVTVAGSLAASAGMNLGTSQALIGTTAMTIGNNSQTVAINSSDWDIDATGIATGMGNITSNGTIEGATLTEGGNAVYNASETPGGELEGTWATPTIDNTGITLTSITIGSLLGVDSIDATGAVDMDYGSADVTDHTFTSDGGVVVVDGDISFQDDKGINLGSVPDWNINFDDSVDDQLLISTAKTSAIATGDALIEILVDANTATGSAMTANQQVFSVAKGTQASNVELLTVDEDGDVVAGASVAATGSTGGVRFPGHTSDPCTDTTNFPSGTQFYNSTSGYFCFCNNSNADIKMDDNTTACF